MSDLADSRQPLQFRPRMKSPLRPLLFVSAVVFAPLALVAQTSPAAPATTVPALSPQQLNEGFRTGFNTIVTQALVPGAIKVSTPPLLANSGPILAKANKTEVLTDFNSALSETVGKVVPKAVDLIKTALKDVKIEDAKILLSGAPDAGTQFLRKAVGASVREALLPLVKQTTAATDLVAKAKTVLETMEPRGVKGGTRMIADLEDYVCNQVIAQSFKLIAQKEAAVRANPALLTGNVLAQKVFALYKK